MATETKQVEFENPVFKKLLAMKLNVYPKHLKYFIMPVIGDQITLGNVVYKITYVRENPFRFACEPVAILPDSELEKSDPQSPQNLQGDQDK